MFGSVGKAGLPPFSHGHWRLNLKDIFGTTSLVKILIPTMKKLPIDGVDWDMSAGNYPEINI